ncbi:MAG: hypothetical protein IKF78_12050 [Atopobiaceae bacterium]|nr:hypothetical protein [Atopobiaceae bacterium]
MTTYRMLFALGILLLVGALMLLVHSARFYCANNIRGVRDDLSGKARRRGIEGLRPMQAVERSSSMRATPALDVAPTQVLRGEEAVCTQVQAPTRTRGAGKTFAFDVVERLVLLGGMEGKRIEGECDEAS